MPDRFARRMGTAVEGSDSRSGVGRGTGGSGPGAAVRGRRTGKDRGPMRLTIVTENFYPTESSGGRLLTDLAVDLAARGVEVTAVASRASYRGRRSVACRDSYRGVEIRRVPAGSLPRENPAGRLFNELVLTLGMFVTLLVGRRADRILVTSSPPFLAPAVALAAAIRRVEVIFVVMDVFPEMAAATGLLQRGSLPYRCWDALSRFACRRATRTVVLGRCMKEVVRSKLAPGRPEPVVLPNWADGREIRPLGDDEPNRFLAKYPHLKGKFIVQYSGNLGRFHDFETVLQAADRLREREDIRFVLIGQGAKGAWLEAEISRRGLANVELLPFQPQVELVHSLAAQSVSLVTLERGAEGLCVPSKFYPILAAGKPVIAVMDGKAEVARVVAEEGIGEVVAQGDGTALAAVIDRLSRTPDLVRGMGLRARELQQRTFDRTAAVERYHELLLSLDAPGRGQPADARGPHRHRTEADPVVVSEANLDDQPRLVEMHLRYLGPRLNLASLLGPPFVRAVYHWFLTAPHAYVLKATVGDEIVGFTTLSDVPYTRPMLSACRGAALSCLLRRPWLLLNPRLIERLCHRPRGIGACHLGGIAQVGFTAVVPGYRGRGVGSRLKEASIRACRKRGCRGLLTGIGSENTASIALNERFGFRAVEGAEGRGYRYYLLRFPGPEVPAQAGAGEERARLSPAPTPAKRTHLQGMGR